MKHRVKRRFEDMVYRMRTAGSSPAAQAVALGLGVFIGSTPFFGLHLALCLIAARVFRLSPVTMYAGSQVSYPVFAPFLYFGELQIGTLVRTGEFMDLTLHGMRSLGRVALRQVLVTALGDVLVGAVVIGAGLGLFFGLAGYQLFKRTAVDPERARVADAASRRYLESSIFDWEFARSRLKNDPVYTLAIEKHLLPDQGLLIEIGCGRGLFMAFLREARQLYADGAWPEGWADPPRRLRLHGIEHRLNRAVAAKKALGRSAVIQISDLGEAVIPECAAATLLDVLHQQRRRDQEELLARVARSLKPGGVLLLRETDKEPLWRYLLTRLEERVIAILRFRPFQTLQYRSAREWSALLEKAGLVVETIPAQRGPLNSNVLIVGRKSTDADSCGNTGPT